MFIPTLFLTQFIPKLVTFNDKDPLNVYFNFIPNKLVTFNDKDQPWMSEYLKSKIK